jgi:DNA-binding PadR family transcriptional regulator
MSVRHALLALLSEGPKYGLQLRQEFEARTGEVWPLNVGQVYTTLQRLERDGLVEAYPPPRDELVIKVLVALTVPGVDVHEVVQAHRRHLVETMQRYTHVKGETPEDDLGLALVVDAEIFRLDAAVRWLDAADARLARFGDTLPPPPPAPSGRTGRLARLGVRP